MLRTFQDAEVQDASPAGDPAPADLPLAPRPRSDDLTPPQPPPAEAPAAPVAAAAPASCPRCSGILIDPAGLGWCQKCGYCHSLEQDQAKVPLATATPARSAPSPFGVVESLQILAQLPAWFWVLLGGVAAIVGGSFVPARVLPPDSLVRAIWCTGQIGFGVLLILAAQIWAVFLLAPEDEKLGNRDAFFPGRLWALAARKLPRTCRQVWLACWGLAAIAAALFVVGGLSHWLTYLPKGNDAKTAAKSPW